MECRHCGEILDRPYLCRVCDTKVWTRCFECHCEKDHNLIFPNGSQNQPVQMGIMRVKPKLRGSGSRLRQHRTRCSAITRGGDQCKCRARVGEMLCSLHKLAKSADDERSTT